MVKEIKGDLVEMAKNSEFDMIIHQANCFNTMGSGIALQIKNVFPQAYEADLKTVKGDRNKLGTFSSAFINGLIVCNMYSQFDYFSATNPKKVFTQYDKMENALENIRMYVKDLEEFGKPIRIGIPKLMGCDRAGGDWNKVLELIENKLGRFDTTIVKYNK